jgi:DNA recombination protein RmuC
MAALALAILALAGILVWFVSRPKDQSLGLVQQQITALHEQVSRAMGDVSSATGQQLGQLHERLDGRLKESAEAMAGTQKIVGEKIDRTSGLFTQLQERLSRMEEAYRQIQSMQSDIVKLNDILRAPKLRGNLGELFLEELLSQILPPGAFEMQYAFRTGEKVDAIIHLSQGNFVPIDAKFPLENFQRMLAATETESGKDVSRKAFSADLKKHVDAIAAKYIRPDEGTLDFALMYIPAENIYYEAILRDDEWGHAKAVNNYALSKRVIPVSPNSLYAYLQAIVLGLKGLKIESQAREIINFLSRLQGDLAKIQEDLDLVGRHLNNAQSIHQKVDKRLEQVRGKVESLEGPAPAIAEGTSKDRALSSPAGSRSE